MRKAYLAVDANPYRIRMAFVADRVLLSTFEAKPTQTGRLLTFARSNRPAETLVGLTGRRYDRWPPALLTALVMEFGPVAWVNPNILNSILPHVDRWRSLVHYHRALFLAMCAERHDNQGLSIFDQFDLLYDWQNAALDDLSRDALTLGLHMATPIQ
jgi:hypothetical protein